jgi:Zn-dependent protease with chaperone function
VIPTPLLLLAAAALLGLLPTVADRLILRLGASPLTGVAVALLTLLGLVAVPVGLLLCSGEAALHGGGSGEAVAVLTVVLLGLSAGRAVARAVRSRHRLRQLETAALAAAKRQGRDLYLVSVQQPLAFTTATGAFISEGLLAQLPTEQSQAVVEHELSHLRTNHWRLLAAANALSDWLFGVPPARRAVALLRRELDVFADRAAARQLGDAGPVVGALERVGGEDDREVGERVRRLRGVEAKLPALRFTVAVVGAALIALLCLVVHGGFALAAAAACLAFVGAFLWLLYPLWLDGGSR